jgi:hypothetical protein
MNEGRGQEASMLKAYPAGKLRLQMELSLSAPLHFVNGTLREQTTTQTLTPCRRWGFIPARS